MRRCAADNKIAKFKKLSAHECFERSVDSPEWIHISPVETTTIRMEVLCVFFTNLKKRRIEDQDGTYHFCRDPGDWWNQACVPVVFLTNLADKAKWMSLSRPHKFVSRRALSLFSQNPLGGFRAQIYSVLVLTVSFDISCDVCIVRVSNGKVQSEFNSKECTLKFYVIWTCFSGVLEVHIPSNKLPPLIQPPKGKLDIG